jgi:hypothetical protein
VLTDRAGLRSSREGARLEAASATTETPAEAGDIFESTITLTLNKLLSSDDWPVYVSQERVPNTADRRVINSIYIHRSWLPTPTPAKLKVRFEKG